MVQAARTEPLDHRVKHAVQVRQVRLLAEGPKGLFPEHFLPPYGEPIFRLLARQQRIATRAAQTAQTGQRWFVLINLAR